MGGSNLTRHERRAQALALVVLVLPALIGTMGLAVDVSNYYFNYVKLQAAADNSVLSGAKYLPDQPCAAVSTANIYATCFNNVSAGEVVSTTTGYGDQCPAPASTPAPLTCASSPAPTACATPAPAGNALAACNLTMTLQRSVPFVFARLVGVTSGTLSVTATATTGVAGSILHGLVPVGVQYKAGDPAHSTFPVDSSPVLLIFTSPTTPGSSPSNWSALALGGSRFTSIFPAGYNGSVSLGDAVAPDRSATTTGPVTAAIQARISAGSAADPGGTAGPPPQYIAADNRAVTVALVDWSAPGGCCKVNGFAELWIDSVSNGNISGRWIANGIDGSLSAGAPNFGALAIKLTQ